MTIHVELNANEERMLLARARLIGRDLSGYVHQVLQDHIREGSRELLRIEDNPRACLDAEDLIDYEAIESCARAVAGQEVPSLDEVRRLLAKVKRSMTQAVIEEREDRY